MRGIDLFCGAGGSSWGARAAGIEIVAAFDRWDLARKTYAANFPNAVFQEALLEKLNVRSLRRRLGSIDILLASPECTSHSPAKGKGKRSESSKATAFQVVRFAEAFKPRWVVVENVVHMRRWGKYHDFCHALLALGYQVSEQVLNAADFGVPQRRNRLFLLCDKRREPAPLLGEHKTHKPAQSILDNNARFLLSPLRTPRRAAATLERAERAISVLGRNRSFLLVYYSSDGAGGWQRVTDPLRTITTHDRFALVKSARTGHVMRMLQVPELKAAMGMPPEFKFEFGNRRERIHLIGNAVCPPVMERVIRHVIG